jgi:hypothetical protein
MHDIYIYMYMYIYIYMYMYIYIYLMSSQPYLKHETCQQNCIIVCRKCFGMDTYGGGH